MRRLDTLDRRLLNRVQADFPLGPRPYARLGDALGTSEEEVLARVARLREAGIVRQISAIFDTRALGYKSTLVAMRLPRGRVDAAARVVNAHPGVSHNYRRNHAYNLWFTLAVPPGGDLEATVARLGELAGAEATRLMPTLRLFKIGMKLDMTGEGDIANGSADEVLPLAAKEPAPLSAAEVAAVRELQEDLPTLPEPFAPMAQRLGIEVDELLAQARSFIAQGRMRRFAAVLHHRRAGFGANAMGVWSVPKERIEEVGQKMASYVAVSHCYQRPTYEDWPYNLFTMIHARKAQECERLLEAMSRETGITRYAALYSTKEYKKVRLRYFTEEY